MPPANAYLWEINAVRRIEISCAWLWAIGLFFFALSVRWIYLEQIKSSPFFDVPIVDAKSYMDRAVQIARGEVVEKPFWQPPLYPYFLGLLYKVFGERYDLFRWIQLGIGSLSCLLVYWIGRRIFGTTVGVVASLMAAVYGIFIYFESELLPTFLSVFLNLALILTLLWAAQGMGWWRWLLSGAVLGLSALAVANVLLFLPFTLIWIGLSKDSRGARGQRGREERGSPLPLCSPAPLQGLGRRVLGFCVGVGLVILPVTLRNYWVGHDFVLISSNAGINFYVGNNPEYDRTIQIRPGSEWWRLTALPKKEGITKPSLQSRFFFAKSWDFIRNDPLGYGKLLLRKTGLFWRGDEIKRNEDIYLFRRYSSVLRLLLWKFGHRMIGLAFPFGIIGPLGLVGIGLCWRRRWEPGILLVLLFLLAYVISVVLFFVSARYRTPVVPVLILFAGYALYWGYERIKERSFRAMAYPLASLGMLFVLVNVGVGRMDPDGDAQAQYDLAYAYVQKGMVANALVHARKSAEMDPNYFEARYTLGGIYALRGMYDKAIREYERALEIDPDYVTAHLDLGAVYMQKGAHDQAISEYRKAVVLDPGMAEAHHRLGYAYAAAGSLDEAINEYRRALEIDSSRALSRRELAFVYAESKRYDEAIREYREVLRLLPGDLEAQNNLGIVYAEQGMADEAGALFKEILKAHPDYLETRTNLAMLYEEQGKVDEALAEYEEILRQEPDYEDGEIHRRMALIYAEKGERDRAVEEMRAYRLYRRGKKVRQTFKAIADDLMRQLRGRR